MISYEKTNYHNNWGQSGKYLGQKYNCNVLFHCGKTRNGGTKKEFRPLIRKADSVVVLLGACGHVSQELVKELCKEQGVKIVFKEGFGASGAIKAGLEALNLTAKAAA